ncbi:MAG: aminotransferase class V-fold PLP-dependent enzyme [Gemmatimonadota bacterium]|nr:aminotransferase class V-fold PLP-dependent enzyme [Gemmatimonadota bacterium]
MTHSLEALRASPNALSPHYSAFRVRERLLLTGHSHQAWPDVGFEGQKQAWLDAAAHADGKWSLVAERVDRVAEGYRALMGDCDGDITLDTNTHSLVIRFLSALPLRDRPRIVTTDGEFHTIRRQLDRMAEEGLEVVKVPAAPVGTLSERVAAEVDDRTAAVMMSSVLFATGLVVPDLPVAAQAAAREGAEVLIDSYHSLGAVPFTLRGMQEAFVVGGGYKYLQLGEGNCALRVPPDCALRPVLTGWFSEFAELADARVPGEVRYGRGAARFAGSTYDPTSAYRGAAVLDFFDQHGLRPDFLRLVSLHQVGLLLDRFRGLDLDPSVVRVQTEVPPEGRGGFLALEAQDAAGLFERLLERGVRTDYRDTVLRFGPAPYLCDDQIVEAMEMLGAVVRS